MTEPDWNLYPNFSRSEFVCHCGCDRADMDPDFMDKLQAMRTALGFAFPITSGFRCEDHNRAIHGGPAHPLGKAADIACFAERAALIADGYGEFDFMGLGVAQKSGTPMQSRFLHLDILTAAEAGGLRPRIWSY